MSAHTLISPYINRFVNLIHQNATAKLELSCTGGKVKVNILHDLGEVEDTSPKLATPHPTYSDALKKNVRLSQINRLQKRAHLRAEEARNKTKDQQKIAEDALLGFELATEGAEKAQSDAKKAKLKFREDKLLAEEASELYKGKTEEAEVQASRDKNEAEKAECIAQHARQELFKLRLEAEQAKSLLQRELVISKEHVSTAVTKYEPSNEAVLMDSLFKNNLNEFEQQCEYWKNIFTEQCLKCDQCKTSFNKCSAFKEHIDMEHNKNKSIDYKDPIMKTKNAKRESFKVKLKKKR